jgi:hypothetical protein
VPIGASNHRGRDTVAIIRSCWIFPRTPGVIEKILAWWSPEEADYNGTENLAGHSGPTAQGTYRAVDNWGVSFMRLFLKAQHAHPALR